MFKLDDHVDKVILLWSHCRNRTPMIWRAIIEPRWMRHSKLLLFTSTHSLIFRRAHTSFVTSSILPLLKCFRFSLLFSKLPSDAIEKISNNNFHAFYLQIVTFLRSTHFWHVLISNGVLIISTIVSCSFDRLINIIVWDSTIVEVLNVNQFSYVSLS